MSIWKALGKKSREFIISSEDTHQKTAAKIELMKGVALKFPVTMLYKFIGKDPVILVHYHARMLI